MGHADDTARRPRCMCRLPYEVSEGARDGLVGLVEDVHVDAAGDVTGAVAEATANELFWRADGVEVVAAVCRRS
jgi:hypothetical protein